MRVLVYLWTYPPFRFTGGELMTSRLLEHLVQCGHDVHVYVENLKDDTPYWRNGVYIQSSAFLSGMVASTYDVFITHPEIRTGAIRYVGRLPYIGIVHNTQGATLRSLDRQPPDLTVANSHFTLQYVPRSAKDVGAVVLQPPVTTADGREGTPAHGDIPRLPARSYVTAVNVSHEKGGAVVRYLAERNPDVNFLGVIGGHGDQLMDDWPDNMTLIPPTDDMDAVYAATNVLIFPTKRESYGMVAAEAMVRGIPCIVSDIPALHEVCEDAAMYVDPHVYTAWNDALHRMMEVWVHDDFVQRSKARGQELIALSLANLDRWEMLVRRMAKG